MKIINTGVHPAQENMDYDAKLLEHLNPDEDPILHLYDWEGDSLSYGYFIRPQEYLNLEFIKKNGIQIARRPTGGGIVFHLWDLAFSFLMPAHHPHFSLNTLDNYKFVNTCVLKAVKDLIIQEQLPEIIPEDLAAIDQDSTKFCMARPTKFDVILDGKKIAGAAQRKTKNGYLHQGTISLASPREDLLKGILLPKNQVFEAIMHYTYAPLGPQWEEAQLKKLRLKMNKCLEKSFNKVFSK